MEIKEFTTNRNLLIFGDICEDETYNFVKNCNELIENDNSVIQNNDKVLQYVYGNNVKLHTKDYIPEVNIYLNSLGGNCYDGYAIIDKIRELNNHCKVNIIATGSCMSMAIPILLTVPYENRFCTKFTTLLIHQAGGSAMGTTKDIEDEVKEMKRLTNISYDIIIENTGITREMLENNYNKKEDWIIDAEEAKNLGIIKEIK